MIIALYLSIAEIDLFYRNNCNCITGNILQIPLLHKYRTVRIRVSFHSCNLSKCKLILLKNPKQLCHTAMEFEEEFSLIISELSVLLYNLKGLNYEKHSSL